MSNIGQNSVTGKKKQQVEHKITHSALRLFEKSGYDAVSIDDIAEAAEVSKRFL